MGKICGIIYKMYNIMLIILTAILACLALYQVLARYAFAWPLSWTEELMRYMHCAIIMLGMSVVIKEDSFISVTLFPNMLRNRHPSAYRALGIFRLIIQIAFFVLLTWFGWVLAYQSRIRLAATLQIPYIFVYLCLPLCGLFGSLASGIKLLELIRSPVQKEKTSEGEGFK